MSKVHKEDAQWVTKYNGFNDGKSSANGVGGKKVSLQTKEITAMSKTKTISQILEQNGVQEDPDGMMEDAMKEYASQFSDSQLSAYKEELVLQVGIMELEGEILPSQKQKLVKLIDTVTAK